MFIAFINTCEIIKIDNMRFARLASPLDPPQDAQNKFEFICKFRVIKEILESNDYLPNSHTSIPLDSLDMSNLNLTSCPGRLSIGQAALT
jgi:hypothetical protein